MEELREKAKGALHERLQRLRATRAVDEPTRRDADAAIEKRLAALRSIGQGGESLPGTEESAVQDIIREARAGIDRATAKEENSRTGRSDREAEQQRCDISTKSGIRETKHSIAKEHPKRPSRKQVASQSIQQGKAVADRTGKSRTRKKGNRGL